MKNMDIEKMDSDLQQINFGISTKRIKKGERSMSEKTTTEVVIGGKICTLSGYEEKDYLQKVAAYIDGKISELDEMQSARLLPAAMKSILIHINLADDYFKAKDQIEQLEQDII